MRINGSHILSACALLSLAACAPTFAAAKPNSESAQQISLQATSAPTPTRDAAGAASTTLPAFITLNLKAGFPLDPFLVSVNGGGAVKASTLATDCAGYITPHPTLAATYTGKSELLRAFYFSEHDAVLVVKTPDGKYLCSDDHSPLDLDPLVELKNPGEGMYALWVGSHNEGQLIPGFLALTAKTELDPLTFSLRDLVRDPQVTERRPILALLIKGLQKRAQNAPTLTTDKPLVVENVRGDGRLPAYELPVTNAICNGFISAEPTLVFHVADILPHLRVYFEGDGDATLILLTPEQRALCNDDFSAGKHSNPLIDAANPPTGTYAVFVGRVNTEKPVTGNLTVTTSATAAPAAPK